MNEASDNAVEGAARLSAKQTDGRSKLIRLLAEKILDDYKREQAEASSQESLREDSGKRNGFGA